MFEQKARDKKRPARKPPKPTVEASRPKLKPTAIRLAFQLAATPSLAEHEREADAAAAAVVQAQSGAGTGAASQPLTPSDVDSGGDNRAPYGIIVDDTTTPGPGQIRRGDFMDQLGAAIERVAGEELAPSGRTAQDCPYLTSYLDYYRRASAAHIESTIQRYAQPDQPTIEAIEAAVLARVRSAVHHWVERGTLDTTLPSPGAPPPSGPPIQAKSYGSPVPSGNPAAVRAQLRNGRPLEDGVRSRMERGFGNSFGHVRLHTDATAARLASSFSARAFTIGHDVAFGAGEYRPGTLDGDILIAHELAHVVQQRAAANGPSSSAAAQPDRELEADANLGVAGALAPQYAGTTVAPPRPGLTTPLNLSRCKPPNYVEDPKIVSELGLEITQDPVIPAGTDALAGMHIHYELKQTKRGPFAWVYTWTMYYPGGGTMASMANPGNETGLPITTAGDYRLEVHVRTTDAREYTIVRSFHAIEPGTRAAAELRKTTAISYTEFAEEQAVSLTILRPGTPSTQSRGPERIETGAANPATQSATTIMSYHVETNAGTPPLPPTAAYRWWAIPSFGAAAPQAFEGRPPIKIHEQDAFDLGRGPTARFPASGTGLYVIGCDITDQGNPIGEARYLQSVLSTSSISGLERLEKSSVLAQANVGQILPDKRVPINAIHVTTQTGDVTPLRLYIGPAASGTGYVLVDATPGLDPKHHTLVYSGSTVDDALSSFDSGNHYPRGVIHLRIDANTAGIPTLSRQFDTTGSSLLDRISMGLGIASALLLLGAVVAAPFTGGGSLVVGLLLLASALTGAAAAGVSLAERFRHAQIDKVGVTIDILTIVASLLGAKAIVLSMRAGGNALFVAGSATRFLLWTSFSMQGVAALLISVQGVQQIADIIGNDSLNEDQKQRAISAVVTQLILTGGLLAVSYGDMTAMRTRLRGALGTSLEGQLSTDARMTLSLLDEATLRSMVAPGQTAVSPEQLERLAQIMRSDPASIAALTGRAGLARALGAASGNTLEDLEWAFVQGQLEDHGLPTANARTLTTTLRDSALPRTAAARLTALTPAELQQLLDVPAPGMARLLGALDTAQMKAGLAHATGAELDAVLQAYGKQTLTGILDQSPRQAGLLGQQGRSLIAARGTEGVVDVPVTGASVILDNNTQSALQQLMSGRAWGSLQQGERNAINRLRGLAGLPPLTGDPPGRTLPDIIGPLDIVIPAVALAEGRPLPGVVRRGLAISVSRESPEYRELLGILERVPQIPPNATAPPAVPGATAAIGGPTGFADRALVADAFFASTTGTGTRPRLVTFDEKVYSRLFAFNRTPLPAGITRGANESLAAFIQRVFPDGFLAVIDLPAAGKSVSLTVVPAR